MNTSRSSRGLLSVLVVVVLFSFGCSSSMNVTHDYNPTTDFSKYKTYAWMEKPHEDDESDAFDADLFESRLHAALDQEMATRGFKKVPSKDDNPDFLIAYHAGVQDQIDVTAVNDYYGYPYYSGYPNAYRWDDYGSNTYVREYDKGTLILDFLDAADTQLFWRSVVQAEISESDSPQKRQDRLQKAIKKMLDKYPLEEEKE